MSFREKSAWVVLLAMLLVYGGYALRLFQGDGLADGSTGALFTAVTGFVAVAVAGHIVIAALSPKHANEAADERDRRIALLGDRAGGYALGAFALAALALALIEGEQKIANLIFLGLAGSEIVKNLWQVALYRREA